MNRNIFNRIPVDIQNRNGFDKSFRNVGTATCGTLIPVLSDFVMPNESIHLSATMNVNFPPFATDFKGRIFASLESFFVPARLCFAGWKRFVMNNGGFNSGSRVVSGLPWYVWNENDPAPSTFMGTCSLADYLGIRYSENSIFPAENFAVCNILKFLGYHLIWNKWYRNKSIQRDIFPDTLFDSDISSVAMDFNAFSEICTLMSAPDGSTIMGFNDLSVLFSDRVSLWSLRQRNYQKDYFTAAFPQPQGSNNPVSISTSGDSFTIASLRAGNAMQQFLERFELAGVSDYDDIMYASFGRKPADASVNHPIYLGRIKDTVFNTLVEVNSNSTASVESSNPFVNNGTIGASAARGYAASRGNLVNFTATEFGYLFVLFSVYPEAMYAYGKDRVNMISDISQLPWPLLQSVGMEEIKNYELFPNGVINDEYGTFGYTERYSWMKFHNDEVHGLLRPSSSLSAFTLVRNFASLPELGSEFLQVNVSDLDGVFATDVNVSGFSCWYDIYFDYKVSMPLAAYCVPTLGDPRDTHTQMIDNGGTML